MERTTTSVDDAAADIAARLERVTRQPARQPERKPATVHRTMLLACALMLPAMLAIWLIPGFYTQDGPAHVYSSHVLLDLARHGESSPFASAFEARWQPLPNWAGHAMPMALMLALPPHTVDKAMTTVTLVGVALAAIWLRHRVKGNRNHVVAAILASLVAMSFPWLLGFWSFLLGTIVGIVTWGAAWGPSSSYVIPWSAKRIAAVAGLLVLGYFCHPISLGLTLLGLFAIALTQRAHDRPSPISATLIACVPVLPLLAWYAVKSVGAGGGLHPAYDNLSSALSINGWLRQVAWVEPITIRSRGAFPFAPFAKETSPFLFVISPLALLALGLYLGWLSPWLGRRRPVPLEMRMHRSKKPVTYADARTTRPVWIWCALAAALTLGGVVLPDTLGAAHGNYLPQRVIVIGLVLAVVAFDLSHATQGARFCALGAGGLFALALALQTGFVWEYGLYSNNVAARMVRESRESVGENHRVAGFLYDTSGPFRVNPLLHADTMLGVGSNNVVWSNYELAHYYFPLRVKAGVSHPPAVGFEEIARLQLDKEQDIRRERWAAFLQRHYKSIDRLVTRGKDPELDEITDRYFTPLVPLHSESAAERKIARVRVWERSPERGLSEFAQGERGALSRVR